MINTFFIFQFALMETVTTAILDRFPNYRHKKVWVVLIVAVFGYMGGLIFTTNVSIIIVTIILLILYKMFIFMLFFHSIYFCYNSIKKQRYLTRW